jgi:hypothetical protein
MISWKTVKNNGLNLSELLEGIGGMTNQFHDNLTDLRNVIEELQLSIPTDWNEKWSGILSIFYTFVNMFVENQDKLSDMNTYVDKNTNNIT